MPQLKNDIYTIDDIFALPDGVRAELIDGIIYDMAPPTATHQELLMELSSEIHNYIKKNKGECKVYPAPFAVFLNADDKTYVEPDISIICNKDKLTEKAFNEWENNIDTESKVRLWLETMQKDVKKVNKMFGLNLSVKYRYEKEGEPYGNNELMGAVPVE